MTSEVIDAMTCARHDGVTAREVAATTDPPGFLNNME
jgi:hypothetical protein